MFHWKTHGKASPKACWQHPANGCGAVKPCLIPHNAHFQEVCNLKIGVRGIPPLDHQVPPRNRGNPPLRFDGFQEVSWKLGCSGSVLNTGAFRKLPENYAFQRVHEQQGFQRVSYIQTRMFRKIPASWTLWLTGCVSGSFLNTGAFRECSL